MTLFDLMKKYAREDIEQEHETMAATPDPDEEGEAGCAGQIPPPVVMSTNTDPVPPPGQAEQAKGTEDEDEDIRRLKKRLDEKREAAVKALAEAQPPTASEETPEADPGQDLEGARETQASEPSNTEEKPEADAVKGAEVARETQAPEPPPKKKPRSSRKLKTKEPAQLHNLICATFTGEGQGPVGAKITRVKAG